MPNKKTVQMTIDIPADQCAYIEMLAAKEGLTLEQFVLQCLPHPESIVNDTDFTLAEEIMNRNREALKKLSE
jgi:hypothetical protein